MLDGAQWLSDAGWCTVAEQCWLEPRALAAPLLALPGSGGVTGSHSSASRHSNVVILTTSNITERIDVAFVDRADIRQYIGPPSVAAIFKIYLSCLEELMKVLGFFPLSFNQ